MMPHELNLDEVFESAVSVVRGLPKEGPIKPSDELKLKLYAYFKQATHGPNDTPKPRFYQIVEAYKWDAWQKLGTMSKEAAMLNYVEELKRILDTIPENERKLDDRGRKFYEYSTRVIEDPNGDELRQLDNQLGTDQSSNGSSVCMLDASQSNMEDNQIAVAILKLQRGLEETNTRLARIEEQLKSRTSSRTSDDLNIITKIFHNMKTIHWLYISYPILVYFVIRALNRRSNRPPRRI